MGPAVTTVAALLAARADDDRTGVMDAESRWTWREAVLEGAARGALARSLFGSGKPHIGVLLPNGAEYLFWLNAAALASAAMVGINPTRRGEALAADVRATDCSMIVTDAEGAELLQGLDLEVDDDKILVIGTDRYESQLAHFTGSDEARQLIGAADSVEEAALFLLIFTSGTTGVPKAVRCTQGRLAGIAEVAAPGYGYTSEDVCYCPMPLFHGNALDGVMGSFSHGGRGHRHPAALQRLGLHRRRAPLRRHEVQLRRERRSPTSWPHPSGLTTPTTRSRAPSAPRPRCATATVSALASAAISLRATARARAVRRSTRFSGCPRAHLGKPVNGVDLAVISPETGKECPPAEFDSDGRLLNAGAAIGEMVNRGGRGSFEGYYRREDAEQERLRRGWYWTGDLGYVDAEGFFYFAGRTGDWLRVDSGELLRRPGRVDHLAPSRPVGGCRLSRPRHRFGCRRPGHGGGRNGPGQEASTPTHSRHGWSRSPTWDPSGSPATSGSRPRCPRRRPER